MTQERQGSRRFNSGKWLHFLCNIKEIRTSSEQMALPAWSIQEGKGNLEVRFRWGEFHPSISTGTKDKREAANRAPALVEHWIAAQGAGKVQTPFAAAKARFRTELYLNRKETTWEGVDTILKRLEAVYPEATMDLRQLALSPKALPPGELFRERLEAFKGEAAPKYWAEILCNTRKFCRWAVKRGLMPADPTEGIPYPDKSTFARREETWAEEYFEQVLAALQGPDQARLTILRFTGMDAGDLFAFNPKIHVVRDSDGHLVLKKLRAKAKRPTEIIVQPLCKRVIPFMKQTHQGDFTDMHSFTSSLRDRVQRVMKSSRLPVMDLKSLRHTFATYHAERDVPIDVLTRWMGHAPGSTVLLRYYLHRRSTARYMN